MLLTSFMEVGHLFPFPFFKASAALNTKEQLLASIGAENYLDYMLGFIIAYGSYLELQMKIEEVCRILRRKPPAFITPCQMCRHNTSWLCFE